MRATSFGRSAILAVALASSLTACGGHSDDDTTDDPTSVVPAAASQSVDGFIEYLKRLVVTAPETLEPVDVSNVTPPTTDTAEPATVE
jgi:hypothetical protein